MTKKLFKTKKTSPPDDVYIRIVAFPIMCANVHIRLRGKLAPITYRYACDEWVCCVVISYCM